MNLKSIPSHTKFLISISHHHLQLVQMFIGDGAKLVRDAFDLAKEKITKEGRKGTTVRLSTELTQHCPPLV